MWSPKPSSSCGAFVHLNNILSLFVQECKIHIWYLFVCFGGECPFFYINFCNFPWKTSMWENWWKITRTAPDNRIRESQMILFAQFIFEQSRTVQCDRNWKQCCLIIIHGVKYTQFQTVTKNVFQISTQKTPSNSLMICKFKFKVLLWLVMFSSFKFICLMFTFLFLSPRI